MIVTCTDYEERAAIMEFHGNMPRKEAEAKAAEDVIKTCSACSAWDEFWEQCQVHGTQTAPGHRCIEWRC